LVGARPDDPVAVLRSAGSGWSRINGGRLQLAQPTAAKLHFRASGTGGGSEEKMAAGRPNTWNSTCIHREEDVPVANTSLSGRIPVERRERAYAARAAVSRRFREGESLRIAQGSSGTLDPPRHVNA
jgi:hypothetical protein